jgi:hypothetical protein
MCVFGKLPFGNGHVIIDCRRTEGRGARSHDPLLPIVDRSLTVIGSSFLSLGVAMIRKLKSGEYRLYSRKKSPKTGKRRNLGTFSSLEKAKAHERAVQYFKRH